jgi:hypothetical protein
LRVLALRTAAFKTAQRVGPALTTFRRKNNAPRGGDAPAAPSISCTIVPDSMIHVEHAGLARRLDEQGLLCYLKT